MSELDEISWYPHKPILDDSDDRLTKNENILSELKSDKPPMDTNIPKTLESINWDMSLKYAPTLWWSNNIKKEKKEACRRFFIKGIEIRDLGPDHVLCGERGVFATEKFDACDIVGEYTGRVVDDTVNGHYVAALEDKTLNESLGIDAGECGNEMRYINSYLNIAFAPNVTMRTSYINSYPHILIVCLRTIEIGDELLLDYGKAYTDAYLQPKVKTPTISMNTVRKALPGYESDSSSDSSED